MTATARPAWQLSRPDWTEVALGLGLAVVVAISAFRPDDSVAYDIADPDAWLVVLSVMATIPLCWRRHYPVIVFAVCTTVTFLVAALSWETSLLPFVVLFAAYNLGAHTEIRRSAAALGCGLLGTGALFALEAPFFDSVLGLAFPAEMVLLWGLGLAVAHRERAADRARKHLARAERDAVARSERAVLEERMRVARDLHDLVSSSLSAIAVQAAEATPGSGSTAEVLRTIETTNHLALQDLRRLLRALRLPPSADDAMPSQRALDEARLRASLAEATGWAESATDPPNDSTPTSAKRSVFWDRSVDVALGLTVVAINVVGSLAPDPSSTTRYEDAVVPVLVVLASAPGLSLVVRRSHPVATLAITFLALTAVTALGWQTGTLPATLLIALFALGAWASPQRGLLAVSAVAAAMVAMAVVGHDRFAEWVGWGSLLFVAPYVAGVMVGRRRRGAQRLLDAAVEAEREAVRTAERAVAAERLAVARDLHDLVTHSLAAVAVLAATAQREGPGAEAFVRIQDASRQALTDLRAMLSSLRRADDPAHLDPAPGLKELVDLTSLHSATHSPVRLDLDERVATEAPSLRTTVFRIVQEALTNAGRHSPGAPVDVCVRHTEAGVSIRVHNEPSSSHSTVDGPGSGWGLVGMHERVELYGGNLVARPTHEGGFEVAAELFRTAPA